MNCENKKTSNMSTVVVVGSASIDHFFRCARLPGAGETVMGTQYLRSFGGKGANQAVQCALLGSHTVFVGRVGCTNDGAAIVGALTEAGVDCAHVNTRDDGPPGSACIEVHEGTGENRIIVVPGTNALVCADDAPPTLLKRGAHAVFQLEVPAHVTYTLMARADQAGATVYLNPSPMPPAPGMAALREALPHVHVLVVNEHEAEQLLGDAATVRTVEQAAAACSPLLALGPRVVVLTLGAAGAVYASQAAGPTHVPAPHVERVVDTTGAGDSFLGALVHFLATERAPLTEAVVRACVVAAYSVQRPGCQASYGTKAQVGL